MLIIPDEVVTGALVNAIAVVGRQITKAVTGMRESDDVATARWFDTFRLTGTLPDQPDLSPETRDRLAGILNGDEIQAALQELLAVRLTDGPEIDASQARAGVRLALSASGPAAARFADALVGYYDDQICSLVGRLEGQEPPFLAQIRSEAFSARIIRALRTIERHTAVLADAERQRIVGQAQAGPRAGGNPVGALQTQPSGLPAGRRLVHVTDPFALEVHRPVQADDPPPGLPVLPAYVPREHDRALAEVAQGAAAGYSGMAILVGGSSTGKTRACWEALWVLRDLPQPWRLWHPIDPSRPDAALRELPSIGPRTVVWLNEAQFYLDAPGGLGEQVAAGLRALLRDPGRGPVLVLATLWPQFWDSLTARPPARAADLHAQARELLSGRDITVPAVFTAAQVRMLVRAADPRLAMAAVARDGQVIQFLAGVPELLARYRNAPPAAAALISAAIDGRRLGMGVALPLSFLEAAAPGYLTEDQWDRLDEDWLGQALDYTAADCMGTRGPLTRIRPRPSQDGASDPACRLADYLDQYGHRSCRDIPPASFWTAAATFAEPSDLHALAAAAKDRGLLRDAARLYKQATAHGDTTAAENLIWLFNSLDPTDKRPAQWVAARVPVHNPYVAAKLLGALWKTGAEEQAKVLAGRVAAGVALSDPEDAAILLYWVRDLGAEDQVKVLASRAAADATLDDPEAVVMLLHALREAGAEEQAADLIAADPSAHVHANNPDAVARLLYSLRDAGAEDQVKVLASRAAADATLNVPDAIAALLSALRDAGAEDQVKVLASRAAADATLGDPSAIGRLLSLLRRLGAEEQVKVLASRAADAPLSDPRDIGRLVRALREVGADDQARQLASRAAADTPLGDPRAIGKLVCALQEAGADDQARQLASRAAADAPLDDPRAAALLVGLLWKLGAEEQVNVLASRAAADAPLDDMRDVATLLGLLRKVGAEEQVKVLASRAAAHAALNESDALRQRSAEEQASGFLAADPSAHIPPNESAHVSLDNPYAVAPLLRTLREAGADDQARDLASRAATDAALNGWEAATTLLKALREADADDQVDVLLNRLPAAGLFDLFCKETGHQMPYRFGRELDGSPAAPWGWDALG